MVRSHRRGFSLIEVLIVMAVILTLMGIGVLAYQHIEKVAGDKSTTTRLEMCASMLNEYDVSAGGLGAIEGPSGSSSIYPYSTATPPNPTASSIGSVAEGASERDYYVTAAPHLVQRTGLVMKTMAQVPSVKVMLSQIPGAAMLTKAGGAGTGLQTEPYWDDNLPPETPKVALPVLLDGWRNPIIYVPSGGLTGVYIGGPPPQNTYITTNAVLKTVVSVDGRPFWASAGPDGDFHSGDDNLYSCPVLYK